MVLNSMALPIPMNIVIISDVICPWCFIGKQHLEQALNQLPTLKARIHWQPFFLNPDMPSSGMPRQAYLNAKFGGEEQAQQVYSRIRAAGENSGIHFNFAGIRRTPNTLDAHRLLHWAAPHGVQHQLAGELFRRYFLDAEDIGDPAVLIAAGQAVGLDGVDLEQQLHSAQDQDLVSQTANQARTAGVHGVPFFIFEGRYTLSGAQAPEILRQAMEQIQHLLHSTHSNTDPVPGE